MSSSRVFLNLRQRAPTLFFRTRARAPQPQFIRPNSTSSKPAKPSTQDKVNRILSRLPPSMQKYTTRLRNAPLSHIVSFLILHEITAVAPLLALFGLFHYTDYVPLGYMMDNYGGYVRDGVGRFEKYFRRKGWFGFGGEEDTAAGQIEGKDDEAVIERWENTDAKYKVVVEVALAYAIVKVLLPVRILGSLWATPWFAGLFTKARGLLPFGKKK